MHVQFVEPSKVWADVIIPTGLNSVALDMVVSHLQNMLPPPTHPPAPAGPREAEGQEEQLPPAPPTE